MPHAAWLHSANRDHHQRFVLRCLLSLVLLGGIINTSDAQTTTTRSYLDPGYRFLGVYGGGDDRHFDYRLGKLSLGDTFPGKAAWWAGVKASRAVRDDTHRHDVLIVYCGERDADLETGKRRLDAWLAAEKDCPTYPELIPAICLGEENTGSRVEMSRNGDRSSNYRGR